MNQLMHGEAAGLNWEVSLEAVRHASERRAWLVAGLSSALTVLTVTALILLIPLKHTIPYLISVDKATGQSEIVSLAESQPVGQRMIEAKYWLAHYVRSREEFDPDWLGTDFLTVERLSSKDEARTYQAQIKVLLDEQRQGKVRAASRVEIISIGLVDDSHAVVRFERRRVDAGAAQVAASRATATMVFSIKPQTLGREKDLIENPIGFEVHAYRIDQDLVDSGIHP